MSKSGYSALLRHTSHSLVFRRLPRSAPTCLLGFIWPGRQRTAPMGRKLQRSFEELRRNPSTREPQYTCLTVLQWNVLADGLAQYGDFERVPREALDWEARSPMLLEEILESQADIVCLQEVNRYEDFFRPRLQRAGFTGAFWPKACSPAEQYGYPCDGCAIFFASERFELLGPPCGQPFYVASGGLIGKQGMLHVLLRDRRSGQRILVATTHLKAKGGQANEAAREVQAEQMMARLASRAEGCSRRQQQDGNGAQPAAGEQRRPLVVLCGDFNDTPASPACRVVREHGLGLCCTWDAAREEGGQAASSSDSGNGASPAQGASMGDAERAPFTTWKFRPDGVSQRTIDFIWFSRDPRLRLLRRWRMPGEAEIGPRGLPCERYPSDHLALCAVFGLLPDAD